MSSPRLSAFGIVTVLGLALAPAAAAAEFLGIESEPESAPAAAAPAAPAPVDATARASESVYASGGVSAQADAVSGHVTVGYAFNPYVGLDTTVRYLRHDEDETWGERYGPDVALVLRYANPTMLTPFVGAGPGFLKWKRYRDGEPFDSDHVYMGNVFGGFSVRLMRHFGLLAVRRQTTYWTEPPTTIADPKVREAKSAITNQFGFQLLF